MVADQYKESAKADRGRKDDWGWSCKRSGRNGKPKLIRRRSPRGLQVGVPEAYGCLEEFSALPSVLPADDDRVGGQCEERRDAGEAAGKIDGVLRGKSTDQVYVVASILQGHSQFFFCWCGAPEGAPFQSTTGLIDRSDLVLLELAIGHFESPRAQGLLRELHAISAQDHSAAELLIDLAEFQG